VVAYDLFALVLDKSFNAFEGMLQGSWPIDREAGPDENEKNQQE
jgi:hypothetical protein